MPCHSKKPTPGTSTCHQQTFAAEKTDSTNLYNPSTRNAIEKIHFRNLYKLPTNSCCSENRLPEPLQASNTLCRRLSGFLAVRMESTNLYKLATSSTAVKTDSTNISKPPTCIMTVKTNCKDLYKPPTRVCCSKNELTEVL